MNTDREKVIQITDSEKLINAILRGFAWIAMLPIAVIVRGYTISMLWLWFIVPIWNWQPLSLIQAIGLSFFTAVLVIKGETRKPNKETDFSMVEKMINSILANLFLLGLGWLLHTILWNF